MSMTVREFFASLREGKYSSVGSYPKFWLAADGGTLSYAACRENALQIGRAIRAGRGGSDIEQWRVIGCNANWEDPDMTCAHTGERIESAYAEREPDPADEWASLRRL